MKTFGLIGYPLSHSFSQKYFTDKFKTKNIPDCQYRNFEIPDIAEFPILIKNNSDLKGLNVTIPYKQQIIQFLNEIDEEAKKIGAVNTIKIIKQRNSTILKGFNTDEFGFQKSLEPLLQPHHIKGLILGTGGASKAVAHVLEKKGIKYLYVSRNPKADNHIGYNDLDESIINTHTIIINSSPLGTYPNIETCPPIPYQLLNDRHLLYDLVYNPTETTFMKNGNQQGAVTKNGYEMLVGQAERAWKIWNS